MMTGTKQGDESSHATCRLMHVVKRTLIRSAGIRTRIRSSLYTTSASTSTKLHALTEALKSSKDVSSILRSCSALATEFKDSPNISSQLGPNDEDRILSILQTLAVSARPEDMRGIEQILHDFYPILRMKPTSAVYTSILLGLANGGHDNQVLNFLFKMPQLPGHFTPTLEQLHAVLTACSRHSSFQFLQDIVLNIRRMGQRPTSETFAILLRLRWHIARRDDNIPTINELSSVIQESARQGLAFDPIIADILYQFYAAIGHISEAKEILSLYELVSSKVNEIPDNRDPPLREPPNVRDKSNEFRSILRDSRDYTDILRLETTFGTKCTNVHWTIVLNNSLRSGNFMQAFEIYDQSKKAGVTPDSALIAPLLGALYRLDTKDPSDESIDRALAIYRDLADAVPPSMPPPPSLKPTLNNHSTGPDTAIYNTLLRMLLASRSGTDYLSVAESLLKEMEDRHLPTDSNGTTSAKIILEMLRTNTFAGDLDIYRENRSKLNEHGYAAILHAYCRSSFRGDLQVPLVTQYFTLVNDMRLQKVPITPKVYTIILHHIGGMARNIRRNFHVLERLTATIRRVHDFITLDASISPDPALWNQLMNTYSRLGCFGDAFRVWEMMYLTGRYDQISVSIVLDACAFAGDLQAAYSVRRKLSKAGFAFDLRNWNTWVECLCRLGRFEEAVHVVCSEMGNDGMKPNVDSVKIIAKFVRWTGSKELFSRLENLLPTDLWQQLPAEIRNTKSMI
jgi:pentatricopeptide repeat protein